MKNQHYNTKQRQKIMAFLRERKRAHLSADDIVDNFHGQGENIGKSTIYRFLDFLVKEGVVRRYQLGDDGAACYQYIDCADDCHDHLHLKCSQCGELFHVDYPALGRVEKEMEEHYGFTVDHTKTVFYGRCGDCRHKRDGQHE